MILQENGIVKAITTSYKGTSFERIDMIIQNKEGVTDLFRVYGLQLVDARKLQQGDTVSVNYKICGGLNSPYKRVCNCNKVQINSIKSDNSNILQGRISNVNNVRGKNKQYDEICFCLKEKGKKVIYCYANKSLAESKWFYKDAEVKVEGTRINRGNEHLSYMIYTIWEK